MDERLSRKAFLAGGLGTAAMLLNGWTDSAAADTGTEPWRQVPVIRRRIRPPVFPGRDFDITDFGAVGDGETLCTEAFRRAIACCSRSGGGRVVVPEGTFHTGAIHLDNHVNLHLTEGAVVRFSRRVEDYLPVVPTRFEGVELWNFSPFVYAYGKHDIAITGSGTLDGQADDANWWPWKARNEDRQALFGQAEQGVPVESRIYGAGHYLRPNFIQPYACRNVLIEGVTIVNSPMWEIHPVQCSNVVVRGVVVSSHGPNNDGCNPESCTDVLIQGCSFDTGDDCIALKAGRNADGRRLSVPCENVLIEGCRMRDGHGGVVIGSEMTGGVRNVFAWNCEMSSPQLDRVLRMKTNSLRGGFIENVHLRDIRAPQVAWSVVEVNFFYEEGPGHPYNPDVRNISVRGLSGGNGARYALYLRGYPEAPVRDVLLSNCVFDGIVPEPGRSVVRLENTEAIVLDNVLINGERWDEALTG
jgi:polygalacturonase